MCSTVQAIWFNIYTPVRVTIIITTTIPGTTTGTTGTTGMDQSHGLPKAHFP